MSLRALLLGDATDPNLARWATELVRRHWDVHVVSLQMGGIPGVEVHTVFPKLPGPMGRTMLVRQVQGLIDSLIPDVLHAFGASPYGELGLQSEYEPFVLSVGSEEVMALHRRSPFGKGKLVETLRQADRLVAPSHALAHMVSARVSGRKLDVIPPGVDLSRFSPGEEPEVPTIGCALPLESDSGQEFLICALRLIVQRNPERPLRLLLAGEGQDHAELDRLARELAMANRTSFLGYVSPDERPKFLRGLTVYAMPVVRDLEGYAQSAMEAASCGLPIVASWVGGLGEVVLDEVTGLLVPPKDPEMLADALERLLDDSSLRADMGANGRALIRRAYDWRQNADQLEAVYQELLEGQPRTHDYLID
ncbi:GDP-mannose-dependent alpha-(1-6)-phosphatidylinositol monomannoside mannosyltransferase [compost metagenome]